MSSIKGAHRIRSQLQQHGCDQVGLLVTVGIAPKNKQQAAYGERSPVGRDWLDSSTRMFR